MPTMVQHAAAAENTAPVREESAATRTATPWRAVRRAGRGLVAATALVLAAQPAVLASSAPAPTWTKQAPATHPPAKTDASMAYDAATSTTVLFGEDNGAADTWTWDGSTWTKQAPATNPSARTGAAMAYDAATGLARDSIRKIAEASGACLRPVQLRNNDTHTGKSEQVMIPGHLGQCVPAVCGAAKWLRAAQCREGWHQDDATVRRHQQYWLTLRVRVQADRDLGLKPWRT